MDEARHVDNLNGSARKLLGIIFSAGLVLLFGCVYFWNKKANETGTPVRINLPPNFQGTLILEEDPNSPPVIENSTELVINVPQTRVAKMKSFGWQNVWREYRFFIDGKRIYSDSESLTPGSKAVYDGRLITGTNIPNRMCYFVGTKVEYEREFQAFNDECGERSISK